MFIFSNQLKNSKTLAKLKSMINNVNSVLFKQLEFSLIKSSFLHLRESSFNLKIWIYHTARFYYISIIQAGSKIAPSWAELRGLQLELNPSQTEPTSDASLVFTIMIQNYLLFSGNSSQLNSRYSNLVAVKKRYFTLCSMCNLLGRLTLQQ